MEWVGWIRSSRRREEKWATARFRPRKVRKEKKRKKKNKKKEKEDGSAQELCSSGLEREKEGGNWFSNF